MNPPAQTEIATFAGGCFWCIEEIFRQQPGVLRVDSGYTGGMIENPTYEQVCQGDTGHAEAIQVTFDPQRVSYTDLLAVFWKAHDPTQLNRQGADVGTQYRSGIYLHDEAQYAVARGVLEEANAAHGGRVVTELRLVDNYSRAEDYHQRYFAKNPGQGSCAAVVGPKVEKFRKTFKARLKR